MVEIRVALPASVEADGLVQCLAALFERSSISFDETHNEVRVRAEWESRSIAAVIGAVQSWLVVQSVASAELWVGDRSYTMVGPRVVAQSGWAA
jgi:hypothetical protein